MILPFAFHVINILILIWPISPPQASAQVIAQPDCNSTCGGVDIPFPFGMNDPRCYANITWFEIECRNTSKGEKPYLKSLNLQVTNFYEAAFGMVEIMNPITSNCVQSNNSNETTVINLRGSPFVYSQVENTFVAVGCNSFASLQSNGTTVGGCVSICDDNEQGDSNFYLENGSCSGRYCCQTSLLTHLSEYNATLQHLGSNSNRDQCSYALVVTNSGAYKYLGIKTLSDLKNIHYAPAMLEWEILINDTQVSFLPSDYHSHCYEYNAKTTSQNTTKAWSCSCFSGFDGNPYVTGGCIALSGFNKNNRVKKWAIVGVCSSLGSITLLICLWRLYKVVRKRVIKKRRENFFKKNGGLLLQQRMSSGEVNVDRTNILFSLKDLKKATDNFNTNRVLGKGGQGTVYKGMLVDGKIVAVKKFKVEGKVEEFINEFVIFSQIVPVDANDLNHNVAHDMKILAKWLGDKFEVEVEDDIETDSHSVQQLMNKNFDDLDSDFTMARLDSSRKYIYNTRKNRKRNSKYR